MCSYVRKISEKLDEVDMIASEYFLEVCSPGAERELKDETQIRDALDEYVYVKLKNPKAGMDAVKGYLRAYEMVISRWNIWIKQ